MAWRNWDRTTKVAVPLCVLLVILGLLLGYALVTGWPNNGHGPTTDPTGSAGAPSPTVTTQSPTAAPTPSPTPSGPSQEDKDKAAVAQAVLDFYEVSNRVRMDPSADYNELKTVAAGEMLSLSLSDLKAWRAKGWRSTKPVRVQNLHVDSVTTQGDRSTAVATYCGNSTGVDVVDSHGESHVGAGRQNLFPTIAKLETNSDGEWRLVQERDGGDACTNG